MDLRFLCGFVADFLRFAPCCRPLPPPPPSVALFLGGVGGQRNAAGAREDADHEVRAHVPSTALPSCYRVFVGLLRFRPARAIAQNGVARTLTRDAGDCVLCAFGAISRVPRRRRRHVRRRRRRRRGRTGHVFLVLP